MAKNNQSILVQEIAVSITKQEGEDSICLTDMAKARTDSARAADVIKNWIRTRTTLEFLGTWERIYNPDFKVVEFDHFKSEAGLPSFVLSPSQWVEKTHAISPTERLSQLQPNRHHPNDLADRPSKHQEAERSQTPIQKRRKMNDSAVIPQLSAFSNPVEFHRFKTNLTPSNSRELENTASMKHSVFAAGVTITENLKSHGYGR